MLASKKSISAKVLFSSVAESLVYLYPADPSELVVECRRFPLQMAVLSGLDAPDGKAQLTVPYAEALRSYEQMVVIFTVEKNGICFVSDLSLSVRNPRVFSFSEDS
jgi:hypothetical protein